MAYSLVELAHHIHAQVEMPEDAAIPADKIMIKTIAPLESASQQELSFLTHSKYLHQAKQSQAAAILTHADAVGQLAHPLLLSENPYADLAKLAALFADHRTEFEGHHSSAVIDATATIAANVHIGPQAVIGAGVSLAEGVCIGAGAIIHRGTKIGSNTTIKSHVVIAAACEIGKNCIIHESAVIGSDGFGNANTHGQWQKMPQIGTVIIEDDVEVGANTTIDRAAFGATCIKKGARIDNLVQIAHGVQIGEHTAIAACVGIAGSTKIGKRCQVGGLSGINGHIEITDDVYLTGMSMVTHSLNKPGVYSSGIPARERKQWQKNVARFNRLNEFVKSVKQQFKLKG